MDAKNYKPVGVAVVGFPYVRETSFSVFRWWPRPSDIVFLLPRRWPIKGGKSIYIPPTDERITSVRAFFPQYHGNIPIIGGLLKGWMPYFPLFLWHNRRRVDLVYVCSEPILLTSLYYGLFTKLLGKNLIFFTWENIDYRSKFRGLSKFVHLFLLRVNLFLADGLMCGNTEGAAIHSQYTRLPIEYIPMNGLDPELFQRNSDRHLHGEFTSKIIFIFAGAIGYRKGIHVILKALPRVLQKIPQAHLIIVGSGEYEAEIERLIDEPFIKAHVTRFPWVSHHELIRLFSISDAFVYPSISHGGWAEQFGYSMAEASLMELPVISTNSGSIPDVVRDGLTGILVPPDNAEALADAMIELGMSGDLRKKMGQAGREYISTHFGNKQIAQRMYKFLSSL